MLGLLKRIWLGIKRFFGKLFGSKAEIPSGRSRRQLQEELPPLSDTDYEFLFMQLLEGVANGWHEGRIVKFFDKLGTRGKAKDWVPWIESFGQRVYGSESSNQQLAVRMIRLGELSQVLPGGVGAIGDTAYRVGRNLYSKDAENTIWEYEGKDSISTNTIAEDNFIADTDNNGSADTETLTLEELFSRLQQDPNLASHMAHQLGLETTDPNVILDALVNQFQAMQRQNENQKLPETVDEWFQYGLQQASNSDWEGAIDSWENALAIDPNLSSAWHNRGSALAMLGRFDEALESYDRALELEPDDYQIWNARGSALFGMQRWQEALSCWDRVLQLEENFYQAWFNRGSTLEQMGRRDEAIECYQKVLELDPTFELAQTRLNNLLSS